MSRFSTLAALVPIVLAVAAPSSGQSVINACITKSTGQIRIVSAPAQCKSNEAPLSWNVQGPQGIQGPQGVQGPAGPRGPSYGDGKFSNPWLEQMVCSDAQELVSYPVTLAEPARIFAAGFAECDLASSTAAQWPVIQVELLNAAGAVVAAGPIGNLRTYETQPAAQGVTAGLLLGAAESTGYTAAAGTYTLRLTGFVGGLCNGSKATFSQVMLSHVQVGTTPE